MTMLHIDVWLYGPLARYGGSDDNIFAQSMIDVAVGSTLQDLLNQLSLPTAERGITFINGTLSAMPGIQPDLAYVLADGERVAFFHLKSMWPFQYRHDVQMLDAFVEASQARADGGRRSRFDAASAAP